MKRYKIDKVEDDAIEFDYIETITLDNYDEVTGKKSHSDYLEKLIGKEDMP